MKKIAPGHLKKPSLQSHPNTKGGTIQGLTETKYQEGKNSPGSTSLSKHDWDDDAVKAAARPEILSFLAPEQRILLRVTLRNPRYNPTQKKGGTIPLGIHGTGGPTGKTLPLPEVVELAGPYILGAFNSIEKLGAILGGRPYKNGTCPEIVDTVQKTITTPTEKILTDDKMADT